MNEYQRQKAIEALDRQKELERKKQRAMGYHQFAYADLHYFGVMLPYRVLYDLRKAEFEGTFKEVFPNPFYPQPAITLKTKWSFPKLPENTDNLPLNKYGLPDLKADADYQKEFEEYKQREEAEKITVDKWEYYYARFLIPYDLPSFTDFDYWGEVPKDDNAKQLVETLRYACMEIWNGCKEHPEKYNFEPVPRLEEHKTIYDVGYNYI